MFGRFVARGATVALLTLTLSGGSAAAQPVIPLSPMPNPTVRIAKIPIPNVQMRSFDISWVDAPSAHFYLADRSDKAIDVIDINNNSVVGQVGAGAFVGFTGNNDSSGPNGVVVTQSNREAWAGDGDSTVKVLDLASGAVAATISTGGKGRADEIAYDNRDNIIAINNPADNPPYMTLISVNTRNVLGKVVFSTANDGLEQPIYDSVTGMFYQALPSTTDHPGGWIAVVDPLKMAVTAMYPLNSCKPHGIAVGPGNQLLAACSVPNHTVLIDRTNGTILADFGNTGATDEAWYNPGDNRYYMAQTSTQTLGIIDAGTMTFVQAVQSGTAAHSVAADQTTNHIFVPIAGPDPACPGGCVAVYAAPANENNGVARTR